MVMFGLLILATEGCGMRSALIQPRLIDVHCLCPPTESGSFRSYSHSVRSFRPDFRGESFRPSWAGRFGPIFGVSRFGLIYLYWENR